MSKKSPDSKSVQSPAKNAQNPANIKKTMPSPTKAKEKLPKKQE